MLPSDCNTHMVSKAFKKQADTHTTYPTTFTKKNYANTNFFLFLYFRIYFSTANYGAEGAV